MSQSTSRALGQPWSGPAAALTLCALLLSACGTPAATGHHPSPLPPATPRVTPSATAPLPPAPGITVPSGFSAQIWGSGLDQPTALALGPDGRLYAAERGGQVVVVTRGSTAPEPFASGFPTPLGLAWLGQTMFISAQGQVDSVELSGGLATAPAEVITGLPFGEHQQDGIAVGPDGRLYLGSGSTCDVCYESSPYSAAILSFAPNGSDLQVVASGLRNPYGLAFQPGTTRLYADVNGQDNLGGPGDPEPADFVAQVRPGADYGWPRCWPDARTVSLAGQCAGVTPPAVYLPPHAAPTGLVFYTGRTFPARYRGNLFVTEYGSSFAYAPTGHDLERVVLGADGTAPISSVSVFASGFQHPIAVLVDPSGALLVADFGTGIIYRIQATR